MPWITIREAAAREGVSKRTIRRRVKDGILPSKMQGGVRLVYLPDEQEGTNAVQATDLSQNILEPLFDLNQDLRKLRFKSLTFLKIEEAWEQMGFVENSKSEQWNHIYNRINDCYKIISKMLCEIKVDPVVVPKVFQTIVSVEMYWTELRAFPTDEVTGLEEQEANTVPQEERILLQRINGSLRRLMTELTRIGAISIRFSDG